MTPDTIVLFLKDKVNVDYPTIYKSADENPIPRWGQVIWGNFRYPLGQFSLKIESSAEFKIMSKKIDPVNELVTFGIREV